MELLTWLTIVAVAYSVFAVSIQRKLVNSITMYEMQDAIKEKSKQLNELVKSKASEEVLLQKQKEISSLLSASMRSSFKPMLVILPVFALLFYVIFPSLFPGKPVVSVFSMNFTDTSYFILVTFVVGLVISMVLMARDKRLLAQSKKMQNAVSA